MDGRFKEYFLGLNQDKLDFLIEFMNKVDN